MVAISTTLGTGYEKPGNAPGLAAASGGGSNTPTPALALRDAFTDISEMATCGNAIRTDLVSGADSIIVNLNAAHAQLDTDTQLTSPDYASADVTGTAAAVTQVTPQVAVSAFESEAGLYQPGHPADDSFGFGQSMFAIFTDVTALAAQVNALRTDVVAVEAAMGADGTQLDADTLTNLDDDYASTLDFAITTSAIATTMPTINELTFTGGNGFQASNSLDNPNFPGFMRAVATDLAAIRAALVTLRTDVALARTEFIAFMAKLDADPLDDSDYESSFTPATISSSAPASLLTTAA